MSDGLLFWPGLLVAFPQPHHPLPPQAGRMKGLGALGSFVLSSADILRATC